MHGTRFWNKKHIIIIIIIAATAAQLQSHVDHETSPKRGPKKGKVGLVGRETKKTTEKTIQASLHRHVNRTPSADVTCHTPTAAGEHSRAEGFPAKVGTSLFFAIH